MSQLYRRVRSIVKWLFIIGLLWGIGHTIIILVDGFSDEEIEKATLVVFGNQVFPNGEVSDRLAARLDKAVALFQAGKVERIYVSGGIGWEGQPEGTVMQEYLVKAGVEASMIVVDNEGNNTQQTAENFRARFGPNISEVVVVSQYYHISRARLAMHKAGYNLVKGVHANFKWEWRDIYSVIREFLGYYSYLFRGFNPPR